MRARLVIDGNAVYEIDEGCMRRRRTDKTAGNAEENGREYARQESIRKKENASREDKTR